jgi:hypothetical protein
MSEGDLVDVVGVYRSSNGRSCSEHEVCGQSLQVGDILHIRCNKVEKEGGVMKEALGVYYVVDGVDKCLVGFLQDYSVFHKRDLEGLRVR